MVTVRKMKQSEAREAQRIAQKAFTGIEKLFISRPKEAMVAVIGDTIVGGIFIKYIRYEDGCIGYFDTAFVDPAYHGQGIGGVLYEKTAGFLWEQGCSALSALVKDDNIGSWKLFLNNGFTPVTIREGIRHLGFKAMLLQYFTTPFFACNGMEFYLAVKPSQAAGKNGGSLKQILLYLAANAMVLMPGMIPHGTDFFMFLYSYILLLIGGVVFGYAGSLFSKHKWRYRLNSGGAVVVAFISLMGGVYPMIGNWYPDKYQNTAAFRKSMGLTAFCEWGFYIVITIIALSLQSQYHYLRLPASLGRAFLLYRMIAVYPFESYGGRRVYQWSKGIYAIMAVISAAVIALGMLLCIK